MRNANFASALLGEMVKKINPPSTIWLHILVLETWHRILIYRFIAYIASSKTEIKTCTVLLSNLGGTFNGPL